MSFRDVTKFLRDERDRKKIGLVVEIASWAIVFAAIIALIVFKVLP